MLVPRYFRAPAGGDGSVRRVIRARLERHRIGRLRFSRFLNHKTVICPPYFPSLFPFNRLSGSCGPRKRLPIFLLGIEECTTENQRTRNSSQLRTDGSKPLRSPAWPSCVAASLPDIIVMNMHHLHNMMHTWHLISALPIP